MTEKKKKKKRGRPRVFDDDLHEYWRSQKEEERDLIKKIREAYG